MRPAKALIRLCICAGWSEALLVAHTLLLEISIASACDFQQCGILTSLDSDETVQPPFKLRNSKLCSVSSLTLIELSSAKQRLWSDCAYAQADLRLCWSQIPHCWKSHALALLLIFVYYYIIYKLTTSVWLRCPSTAASHGFQEATFQKSTHGLETEGLRVRALPESLRCALEQDTLILT